MTMPDWAKGNQMSEAIVVSYHAAKVDAIKKLAELEQKIRAHGTDGKPIDWGHVGDMARYANKLNELTMNL